MSKKKAGVKNAAKTRKPRSKGRPFEKGNPGRPKGSLNHTTTAWREFCRLASSQVDFLEWLAKNMRRGKLRSDLIKMVVEHGHGRPPMSVDVSVDLNLRDYLARADEAPDD